MMEFKPRASSKDAAFRKPAIDSGATAAARNGKAAKNQAICPKSAQAAWRAMEQRGARPPVRHQAPFTLEWD